MNSLNLLSARVIGQSPQATRSRSKSDGEALRGAQSEGELLVRGRSYSNEKAEAVKDAEPKNALIRDSETEGSETPVKAEDDEKKPLLNIAQKLEPVASPSNWRSFVKRLADALTAILTAMGAPIVYVAQYFQDEHGRYSILTKRRKRDPKEEGHRQRCWVS